MTYWFNLQRCCPRKSSKKCKPTADYIVNNNSTRVMLVPILQGKMFHNKPQHGVHVQRFMLMLIFLKMSPSDIISLDLFFAQLIPFLLILARTCIRIPGFSLLRRKMDVRIKHRYLASHDPAYL